jgi:DNA-binding transcriptional ArsR family regulator
VDLVNVSTVGLESSPVADALAGMRANEARHFKKKYDHVFTVEPAAQSKKDIDWVHRILKEARDIVIASPPLEATTLHVDNLRWTYLFYESGLSIELDIFLDENISWPYRDRMQAIVFSALGEPNRLQIVELLRTSSFPVGEIADTLGIRQPQVSKHLKVLSEAGIVRVEPRARQRIYRLQAEPFDRMARWLDSFERVWELRLDSLGDYLQSNDTEEGHS